MCVFKARYHFKDQILKTQIVWFHLHEMSKDFWSQKVDWP